MDLELEFEIWGKRTISLIENLTPDVDLNVAPLSYHPSFVPIHPLYLLQALLDHYKVRREPLAVAVIYDQFSDPPGESTVPEEALQGMLAKADNYLSIRVHDGRDFAVALFEKLW